MNRIFLILFFLSSFVFSQTRTVETDIVKVRNGFEISDDGGTTWYDRTAFLISAGSSGGDVVKVGTPVNNQIGIWTGDGTLEGDADLIYTGSEIQFSPGSGYLYISNPTAYGYRFGTASGPNNVYFQTPDVPGTDWQFTGSGATHVDFDGMQLQDVADPTVSTDVVTLGFLTSGANYNLPIAAFNSGTGATASTVWHGDGTWGTVAGSGDVSKVGTPVDNQIGVWTGDGTIEGDADLIYNSTTQSGFVSIQNRNGKRAI
jgi:hypothetical protein